jgi:hypothetical protein
MLESLSIIVPIVVIIGAVAYRIFNDNDSRRKPAPPDTNPRAPLRVSMTDLGGSDTTNPRGPSPSPRRPDNTPLCTPLELELGIDPSWTHARRVQFTLTEYRIWNARVTHPTPERSSQARERLLKIVELRFQLDRRTVI